MEKDRITISESLLRKELEVLSTKAFFYGIFTGVIITLITYILVKYL